MIPYFVKYPNLRLLCVLAVISGPPCAYVGWQAGRAGATAPTLATMPPVARERAGSEMARASSEQMRRFMHPGEKRQSFRLNGSVLDGNYTCFIDFSGSASDCVSKRVQFVPHLLRPRAAARLAVAGQA